jgi:ribosomal protein S25
MTGERTKLEALETKLGNICDENVLTYRFNREKYPISLTISPNSSPAGQLTMLGMEQDTGFISPEASIVFKFVDGALKICTSETFNISEALFSKLKNMFIKMHGYWLQHFQREVVDKNLLAINAWPEIAYKVEKSEVSSDSEENADETEDVELVCEMKSSCQILEKCVCCCRECPEQCSDVCDKAKDQAADNVDDDDTNEAATVEVDEFYLPEAIKIVRETNSASTSLLQRKLKIGYAKASAIMEELEKAGVIGPYDGPKPRTIMPYVVDTVIADA